MNRRLLFSLVFLVLGSWPARAQFNDVHRIDASSRLIDKETNHPMTTREFQRLNQEFPNQYLLVAMYDRYGKTDYHLVRKKTAEELETGQINPFEEYKKPEIGQPVAPFVMKGADGSTYGSDELKGKYVLLSFWLNFKKPYFGPTTTQDLGVLLKKAKAKGISLVSLGVVWYSTLPECREAMQEFELNFVPVPDGRGFVFRYVSPNNPSYLLIGPDGKVLAHTEGESPLKLEKYLLE